MRAPVKKQTPYFVAYVHAQKRKFRNGGDVIMTLFRSLKNRIDLNDSWYAMQKLSEIETEILKYSIGLISK